jgi:hypothetical protein
MAPPARWPGRRGRDRVATKRTVMSTSTRARRRRPSGRMCCRHRRRVRARRCLHHRVRAHPRFPWPRLRCAPCKSTVGAQDDRRPRNGAFIRRVKPSGDRRPSTAMPFLLPLPGRPLSSTGASGGVRLSPQIRSVDGLVVVALAPELLVCFAADDRRPLGRVDDEECFALIDDDRFMNARCAVR